MLRPNEASQNTTTHSLSRFTTITVLPDSKCSHSPVTNLALQNSKMGHALRDKNLEQMQKSNKKFKIDGRRRFS